MAFRRWALSDLETSTQLHVPEAEPLGTQLCSPEAWAAKGPVYRLSSTRTQWTVRVRDFPHVSPHFTSHESLCTFHGCPAVTSRVSAGDHTHLGSVHWASDLLLTPSSALGFWSLGYACHQVSKPCAEGYVCGQMYQK